MSDPALNPVIQRGQVVRDDSNFPAGYNYYHLSTTSGSPFTIKTGAGFLHSITINTPVATSVITISDGSSVIGVITLPATLLSQGPMTATFDVVYNTSLIIAMATAACDATVSYI